MEKVEKIRLARKALFDKGKIKLVRVSQSRGKMIPINPDDTEAAADAVEYNRLAELHRKMK